jgi:hypothetical protein
MYFEDVVIFWKRKNRQELEMNFGDFYRVNFINSLENANFLAGGV